MLVFLIKKKKVGFGRFLKIIFNVLTYLWGIFCNIIGIKCHYTPGKRKKKKKKKALVAGKTDWFGHVTVSTSMIFEQMFAALLV